MKRVVWSVGLALAVVCSTSMAARADSATAAAAPADDATKAVSDEQFVKMASGAGMAEVDMAKLALQQGTSEQVKKFAQHMIDDHSKANVQLLKLADKDKMQPAERMDAKDQAVFTQLAGLKGAEFDKEYIASQVAAHKQAVALFQAESKQGKNDDLKEFATKTLPVLEHHLDMVKKLSGQETNEK